ncbi:MAG: PAS domain S-box protein, partial [Planctomycetota bacterium]
MSQQDLKPTRRKPARQRYLPASVAAAGGLVLSGIAFSAVQRFEHSRAQAEFERRVQPLVTAVQKEMSGCTAIAESVVALYEASREVERDEFAAFAQHLIAVYPFVSKLEWAPRVDEDERSGLIDYVRAQGLPAFQIAGRRPSGEPPAGEPATGEPHAQHFPICWIAPFKPDETDLGTDCAVDPDCREAIQTALADPGTAAVSATRHVNGAAEGFLRLLTPVYGYGRAPAFEKRPGELSGLVLTTVHVRALLAFALSNRDRQGIAVRLHREPPVAGPSVSGHGAGAADSNWTPAAGGATFGACERLVWCDDEDQAWTMECRSTADYVATGAVWSPWAVLVSGLFLTVLLSLHFVRAAAAGARIERLVERRTAELRVANEGLAREMDERERAAEATRRSEARYRAVTETAQDAVITTDAEGRIRLWNPAAERIFGYRAAEIVGQSMLAHIVPVRYREPMRKAFAEFVRTDQGPLLGKTVELAALRRDGSEFPIELSLSAWRGQQQDIAAAVVRDITARKRAASELLLFRSLLDQANDAIEVIDVETGRFLDINQRACISHGYTREEYLALPVCEIDPGIAQRPWPELVEELRSGTTRDRSRTYESQHRRKDGSFFPVEVSTTFVHLDRDYLLAVVRDITERKQAEEALRREHARAQQYLDIAAFMIVALNQQGEITLLNRKAHAILGYEEGTLIGR